MGKMVSGVLTTLYFTVGTTTSGDSIDFTPPNSGNTSLVIISYSDSYQIFPTLNWTMLKLNTTTTDNLLDRNELFMITVDLSCVSDNASAEELPGPYHTFRIEVKPPVGAILPIERTVPARVDQFVNLY
jgi:archaellin